MNRTYILLAVAGIATVGISGYLVVPPQSDDSIAQLESLETKTVEAGSNEYCQVNYNVSKQSGVFIQLKNGVNSEFYGNGQYHYQQETEIQDSILLSPDIQNTLEIYAYEEPVNGSGQSLKLFAGEVNQDCTITEIGEGPDT